MLQKRQNLIGHLGISSDFGILIQGLSCVSKTGHYSLISSLFFAYFYYCLFNSHQSTADEADR